LVLENFHEIKKQLDSINYGILQNLKILDDSDESPFRGLALLPMGVSSFNLHFFCLNHDRKSIFLYINRWI